MDFKSFDVILENIKWGKYQVRNMISALVAATILGAHVLSPIFISYPVKYQCDYNNEKNEAATLNVSVDENYVISNLTGADACQLYKCKSNTTKCWENVTSIDGFEATPCQSFQYLADPIVETSIVEDFQLICDRAIMTYVLQCVFMAGVFLNGMIFGKLSDRIGRRKVVLVMAVVSLILSIAIAFVHSIELYIILRALIGLFCFTYPTICVLTSETTPPSRRSIVVLVEGAGFSVGIALLVAFAYFIRTWRYLQIALSLLFCVTIVLGWLYDESPRWLISRGKSTEAVTILKKIARVNKSDTSKFDKFEEDLNIRSKDEISDCEKLVEEKSSIANIKVENLGMSDTMRHKKMRLTTFIVTYSWFATSCVYYGLSLNVSNIGGDVHANSMVMGIAGVVAAGVAIFLLRWIGRRALLCSNFILSGIFCVTVGLLPPGSGWFKTVCFHIGRVCCLIPFEVLYLYTIELYPTVLRSTAVNFGSSFARVGSMIAALIAMLHLLSPALPYIVFGLIAGLAGILILLLPETRNRRMFETMSQAEEFIEQHPGPLNRFCNLARLFHRST